MPSTLGRGAKQLYDWLREIQRWSRARGREYVWPSQDSLATQLGVSVPSIRRYLCELERAGLIKRVRAQAGNRYYFLDPAPSPPDAESPPLKMSGPTAQNERSHRSKRAVPPLKMSGPTAQNERCIDDELKNEEKDQQQHPAREETNAPPAAAADLFSSLESQDAKTALLALDLAPPLAEHHAAADPRLAIAVAQTAATRFRDPNQKPVANKVGFVLALLRNPIRCGFTRTPAGDWIPPRSASSAEAVAAAETKRREDADRRRAEAEQHNRERRQLAEALDRWDKTNAATRAAILAEVRDRYGAIPQFALDRHCAAELDRRRQLAIRLTARKEKLK